MPETRSERVFSNMIPVILSCGFGIFVGMTIFDVGSYIYFCCLFRLLDKFCSLQLTLEPI